MTNTTSFKKRFQNEGVKNDLKQGLKYEKIYLPKVNKYMGFCLINRNEKNIAPTIDFVDTKNKIEAEGKHRNCLFNKYNTTIIKKTKIDYFKRLLDVDENWKCYYIVDFEDCLTIVQLTKEFIVSLGEPVEITDYRNNIIDRDLHYHIDKKHLTIIEKYPNFTPFFQHKGVCYLDMLK